MFYFSLKLCRSGSTILSPHQTTSEVREKEKNQVAALEATIRSLEDQLEETRQVSVHKHMYICLFIVFSTVPMLNDESFLYLVSLRIEEHRQSMSCLFRVVNQLMSTKQNCMNWNRSTQLSYFNTSAGLHECLRHVAHFYRRRSRHCQLSWSQPM